MTVVVTGASGHIGTNLLRALIQNGRPTRSLVHLNHRSIDGLDTEIVLGDICDRASLTDAFRGAEVVYHLAACISISMKGWPQLEAINVNGTRNVVEACLDNCVKRLVHFSSIHAFHQEPLDVPIDESRPLSIAPGYPPYDRSKALAELEVRKGIEKGLDVVIVYPTAVIGPYDYEPSYLGEAIMSLATRKLPAMVPGGYDWVDVRDVVRGAMSAEKRAKTGEGYILSGHWVSMKDIAAMVRDITGTPPPGLAVPLWLAHLGVPFIALYSRLTGRRPLYTDFSLNVLKSNRYISHAKATRELDYEPRPFGESLRDTLEWFRDSGRLPPDIIRESDHSS
jgi:dihydroflavonol-4-reductase